MTKPLVTVLVVTYNHAKYIRQAIDSLKMQLFPAQDFEVIVINDGSIDGTSKVLQDCKEGIYLIEHDHRGLVASCNEGLALARGRYFIRLDSDDFVRQDWLKLLVGALELDANACCAYSDRYEITQDQWRYMRPPAGNLYSLEACGTLFYTDALKEIGGFRKFYWEEYDLYLRLCQKGRFIHVPEPLYIYRKHIDSMTHSENRRIEGWLELAKEWGMEILRSHGFDKGLEKALKLYEKEASCK